MKKHLLAWMLLAAMLVACLPVQALATDTVEPVADPEQEVIVVSSLDDLPEYESYQEVQTTAASMPTSGDMNATVSYSLDTATGVLTISGSGAAAFDWRSNYYTFAPLASSIKKVVIEPGITEIDYWLFYGCSNLTSVSLPEGLKKINSGAFGDTALTSIDIPASVTVADFTYESFGGKLATVNVAAGNPTYKSVNGVVLNKAGTNLIFCPPAKAGSYTVPAGVKTIDVDSFLYSQLSSITVPEGVTTIDGFAFSWCEKLTSISLPNSLATIAYGVFYGCSSLTNITIPAKVSKLVGGTFFECDSLRNVTFLNKAIQLQKGEFPRKFVGADDSLPYDEWVDKAWVIAYTGTITGYTGSTVETYAKNNKIPFISLDQSKFTDVPKGEYYFGPVAWAVANGITAGKDDTHFAPNDPCTRAQIVSFLWRAYGSPEPKTKTNPFEDVNSDDYFYKAVLWAVEKGITAGKDDHHFAPHDPCTRAQAVTFQYRAAKSPAVSADESFSDVAAGEYYAKAVAWAVGKGITSGVGGGLFAPDQTCTRAQIVSFLYRQLG